MKCIFTKEQDNYMINNYLNTTYKKIAEYLGFTEKQIKGRLNNLGYTKRRKINDSYSDEIDQPIKAYLLGFIYADGWICSNIQSGNHEFGMQLQSQDKYVLEKINNELGGLNVIKDIEKSDKFISGNLAHCKQSCVLRVYSKNIVLGLLKNGIDFNKTNSDVFPTIKENLFFDFLRGYIDGDGCYYMNKNNTYMHITCSNINFLKYLQKILNLNSIKTQIYKETDKKYRLACTNYESMNKLINKMYYNINVFCLRRKFEKIKHFLGFGME